MSLQILLDVIIGLVLVYALFSLLSTILLEMISSGQAINRRGRMLELAIYNALDGVRPNRTFLSYFFGVRACACRHGHEQSTISDRFFKLRTIRPLMNNDRLPSYIPAEAFARGVLNLIHEDFDISSNTKHYGALARSANGPLAEIVRELVPTGEADEEELLERLQEYYENVIDRVKGWYRRETNYWLLTVGLVVAVVFNVNSIALTERLAEDANLRDRLVVLASSEAEIAALAAQANRADARISNLNLESETPSSSENLAVIAEDRTAELNELTSKIDKLELPFGQCRGFGLKDAPVVSSTPIEETSSDIPTFAATERAIAAPVDVCVSSSNPFHALYNLFGWLLTAIAISLGAPFWFDLLRKLVAIRKAGVLRGAEGETKKAEPKVTEINVNTTSAPATYEDIEPKGKQEIGDVVPDSDLVMNGWEQEFVSSDDLFNIQVALGVPSISRTGRMNKETRKAIREYRRNIMSITDPKEYLDSDLILKLFATAPEQ